VNGKAPPFYEGYVQEVIAIIERNALLEFDCIMHEHQRTKRPRCILTDDISNKINALNDAIKASKLWTNVDLRKRVIMEGVPPSLLELIGEAEFFKNVPENYQKAIFGAHLAAEFVYQYGLETSEFAFMEFLSKYGLDVLG